MPYLFAQCLKNSNPALLRYVIMAQSNPIYIIQRGLLQQELAPLYFRLVFGAKNAKVYCKVCPTSEIQKKAIQKSIRKLL